MISAWLTAWGHTLYSGFVTLALAWTLWIHHRRRPKPPRPGNLYVMRQPLWNKKEKIVANVVATWTKSPSPNVEAYPVSWIRTPAGGSPGAPVVQMVPQSSVMDAGGYSADFNTGNPGVILGAGDVVSATIAAEDTVNNTVSTSVAESPASVTIPTPPPPPAPEPPVAGTLTATA